MIEVFKTNIKQITQAKRLATHLMQHFPGAKINIDLHDCDKVLRVEGSHFQPAKILSLVKEHGFTCSMLE